MSIIRSKKKRNPYVQIDKTPLLDIRLSWKARGLLAYLMTKPDDWEISIANLVGQSESDGRESVQSGLKELETIGYIVRERAQDPQGRFIGWHTLIFETPVDASDYINSRQPGNPLSDLPTHGLTEGGKTENGKTENGKAVCRQNRKRSNRKRSNRQSVSPTTENPLQLINKEELINDLINSPSYSPKGRTLLKSEENVTPQLEEPGTGNQPPRELLDITGQPLNPTTVGMRDVNEDVGCPVMSSDIVTPSLANLSNQPDSQFQAFNPHEEQCAAPSLVGNKAMKLEGVGKNELELETLQECRQNFKPAISQRDEAVNAISSRETSTEDEYSAPAALEAKIAATQTNPPAVLSHQPEQSRVEPNSFGRDENSAVLPLTLGAAIETSPTTPNPSQHQAPARLQADLTFHPRSVVRCDQENRYQPNQSDFPKNLDGSLSLPWDTNKRGAFDAQFENHMARSLMKYPAYCDLMAGELITKVRKHISAGRYDLKRRDELLIEWSAMHDPTRNDFSTESRTLTAKGAARRAKIARALNMKDFS